MKLELKSFQSNAVAELRRKAQQASIFAQGGDSVALVLTAPTGSGKTVMAAALLEALVTGTTDFPADPDATFLWLTDQPELNEQTKRKFLSASSEFDEQRLVTIEAATFDQETLDPGCLYFLNTQKLSTTSRLTHHGDHRTYSLWETVANTAARRPGSLWLALDEAHRGMRSNGRGGSVEEAQSIVQKFIKGDPDVALPPVPLVLGISATPDRFTKLLDQTDRTKMGTTVSPEDVRSSGLLKETISLYHTDEQQPSNESLLAAAAAKLSEFEASWGAYADEHTSDKVRPVLVVQVEDKLKTSKTSPTKTDLVAAIKVLEETLGPLDPREMAHAFQEGDTIMVDDSFPLRYVPPSDIEEDPHLRVVFFKRSLTTGWDCPRAEVMMSFRTAKDETLIAQLVGRMVRTPLARTATRSALLNSVALYLPQYDRDAVNSVIKRLSEPHPEDGLPGTDTQLGNDIVTLKPDPAHANVFAAAVGLPSYKVERIAKLSPIRRLMRLGDRLLLDGLDDKAKKRFEKTLLDSLDAERARLIAEDPNYHKRLDEAALIDVRRQDIDVTAPQVAAQGDDSGTPDKVKAHSINIGHAFADAGRRLGEGLHRAYLKARAEQLTTSGQAADSGAIKREIWVLASDPSVIEGVEAAANALCDAELDKHETTINHLGEAERVEYRAILREGAKPKSEPWDPPGTVEGDKGGTAYQKHMFVKTDGTFTKEKFTSLEAKTLKEELPRKEVVAWLRNVERKSWAFSLYYDLPAGPKAMYPDFLIFREDAGHIVCDILEPHTQSQSDTVAKAKGLAKFAENHGPKFGRIQLLDEVGGQLKRLDFKRPDIRQRVKALDSPSALRQLFEDQ